MIESGGNARWKVLEALTKSWRKTNYFVRPTSMPTRLMLHAPRASKEVVEEGIGYAESLLSHFSHPLEHVFQARARIRSRGAARHPYFLGLAPKLIADAKVLEQAEAIAMLTCYGPRSAPEGSGLLLID